LDSDECFDDLAIRQGFLSVEDGNEKEDPLEVTLAIDAIES
jgi:hypothetical protein